MGDTRVNNHGAVTIFDVAREAGVSYSTVSRVVNDFPHVNPATRAKVKAAMDKLGYVANLQARSLAGGRSNVIGLLVYDLETSYMVEMVRGIDGEVSALNYDLMLSTTHHRRQKEFTYVAKLTRGLVDGILLVLPRNLEAYLEDLAQQHVPYVLIDYIDPAGRLNTVNTTNRQGMLDATRYLLDLGHRRIGFITGEMGVKGAQLRLAGYKDALVDHGLPVNPALIGEGDFMEPSGYRHAREFLALDEPPTAILASSDMSAFGAMRAVADHGLRIPQDVSIVGFDDIPEASYVRPPLTTVRQPIREMGHVATQLLVETIKERGREPQQIKLPTELVIRESSAPPTESVFYGGGS